MGLASGKQLAATLSAAAAMLGGTALILSGLTTRQPTHSLAGLAGTTTALTLAALLSIRRWITATDVERARLTADQHAAQQEKDRYLAARATLASEQSRIHRDLEAERQVLDERLKAERTALAAEFAERRDTLISETMEATVLMIKDGKLAPETRRGATLIHFPNSVKQESNRSRGHGVVGP